MTSLKVAETLKELRHHRGFTQKQLSEQLHISRQAYSIMRMVRGFRIWRPPA